MTPETWSALIAGLALAGTGGAWRTAYLAKQATVDLTRIEARRWHADMTPQFEITCVPLSMGDQVSEDRAELRIRFVGPPGLTKLTVTPTIRDDWPDRKSTLAGGPTQEEVTSQIWGPYRFIHGVDGGSEGSRTVTPITLLLSDGRPLSVERTPPPRWADSAGWRQRYNGTPVRLALHCVHEGDEPWTVYKEVPTVHQ
ncbi:hypothetical protein ABT340_39505 [Streptosporangium sp. NPDC000239]|uniref:hypothetical protein n=1 Tax=Streptosporangium sp. NPDC000239 TaxID=3154248 RepID=UPI00331DAB5B